MGIIYKNGTYYGGGSGGGGAEITVDNELSSTSENPVQNKVIKAELDNKQDADDLMTSADIDDVVTPLPGVVSRLPRYSTEEQIVGYWIDGKPLYQKVCTGTVSIGTWISMDVNSDVDVVTISGVVKDNGNTSICIPYANTGEYTLSVLANDANHKREFAFFGASVYGAGHYYRIIFQYTKTTD